MIKEVEKFVKEIQEKYGEDEAKSLIVIASDSRKVDGKPSYDIMSVFGHEQQLGYSFSSFMHSEIPDKLVDMAMEYDALPEPAVVGGDCNCSLCRSMKDTGLGTNFGTIPKIPRPAIFSGIAKGGPFYDKIVTDIFGSIDFLKLEGEIDFSKLEGEIDAEFEAEKKKLESMSKAERRAYLKDKLDVLMEKVRKM